MSNVINNNLSALVEDEEEMEGEDEGEDPPVLSPESDNEEDESNKEANKFDLLCDGVVGSSALVQTAIQELLSLKDELLLHTLPPAVLIKIAIVCGRVFRSVSDQSKPINELIRMVHVYSTPWEEKSAALKKLHDDYETKQRQLNIAIKRLQLVDSHSKRIAKEKRIMNWEKLFAKVTSTKGHGRRWKFLIETIKQKAKMGYEHVQEYTRSLEESSESESEDEDTLVAQQSVRDASSAQPTCTSVSASEKPESEAVDDDDEDVEDDVRGDSHSDQSQDNPVNDLLNENIGGEGGDSDIVSFEETESGTVSPKRVRFGSKPADIIKPETQENSTWTEEPEYKEYLYVRIFTPKALDYHELKCSVTYRDQMFKTKVLDLKDEPEESVPSSPNRPPAAGRHQGKSVRSPLIEEPQPPNHGRYEEFVLSLDECSSNPDRNTSLIQFAVQHGQFEEIVAMASVEVNDLKDLELQTIDLPPVKGDDDVFKSDNDADSLDSLSDSIDIPLNDAASEKSIIIKNEALKFVNPIPFPLFPLKTGRSSIGPAGSLPLIFYWGRRPQPKHFNRQSGTMGVDELVYDLTGIDLRTTTKEDLHKEMRDDACSAIYFTPEPVEETILKTDYDTMQMKHEHEIQQLQSKYETRLQELMDNLESMAEQHRQEQEKQQRVKTASPRPASVARSVLGSAMSNKSVKIQPAVSASSPNLSGKPATPIEVLEPLAPANSTVKSVISPPIKPKPPSILPPPVRVAKNFKIGKPNPKWGENLPQDFLERLKLFEEESRLRKQELNEKTLEEIKYGIELKLAGQHKLSKREEQMYDALKDVSLPALFMPYKTSNIYNPRAHQYFHPTGSTDLRLTQPPSVFQLPPLKGGDKMSVLNLFDLSRNFNRNKESWLIDKYIQQQQPIQHPGFLNSSDRTLSNFKSSTQLTSGTNIPLESKCGNSSKDCQPQDGARHDQQVEA